MSELKEVYLKDGNKAVLHGKSDDQYIVEVYEESHDYYNDEWSTGLSGRKTFVDAIYLSPPRDLIDESILAANEQLAEIRNSISSGNDEFRTVKADIDALKSELENIAPLRNVIDFMNGDFKYFALPDEWQGPKILEKNIAFTDEGEHERDTKLLTLFGKSDGNLTWKLSKYSDGSGSPKTAIPCKTEEEAKNVMAEWIYKELEERAENNRMYDGGMNKWMISNNYATPPLWAEKIVIYNAENKVKNIERIKKDLQKNQDALKELELSDA